MAGDLVIPNADVQKIVDLAQAVGEPKTLTATEPIALIVPVGHQVVQPDLSKWLDEPRRKTGIYKPATVAAFIAYVNGHHDAAGTTVWVHPTSGKVVAVIDDNRPDGPAWGGHRADLTLAHTPEWNYWKEKDGRSMSQEQFAEHIEAGQQEIVEPDAADVLEIAQTFHATSKASFRSSTRLTSGQVQFQYDNETKASAGSKGDMTIPTAILLEIAPFVGEPDRQVLARFRYRINEGQLSLSYHLDRPHVVIRDALDKVAQTLTEEFPNVYVGEPAPLA